MASTFRNHCIRGSDGSLTGISPPYVFSFVYCSQRGLLEGVQTTRKRIVNDRATTQYFFRFELEWARELPELVDNAAHLLRLLTEVKAVEVLSTVIVKLNIRTSASLFSKKTTTTVSRVPNLLTFLADQARKSQRLVIRRLLMVIVWLSLIARQSFPPAKFSLVRRRK